MGLRLGMLQHATSPWHESRNQAACVLGGDERGAHIQLVKGPQLSPKGSQGQTHCICVRVDAEMETWAACVQMNLGSVIVDLLSRNRQEGEFVKIMKLHGVQV